MCYNKFLPPVKRYFKGLNNQSLAKKKKIGDIIYALWYHPSDNLMSLSICDVVFEIKRNEKLMPQANLPVIQLAGSSVLSLFCYLCSNLDSQPFENLENRFSILLKD